MTKVKYGNYCFVRINILNISLLLIVITENIFIFN